MPDSAVQQGYCSNCGEQARAGAAFCVSCGESLSTPQQTVDHAPQAPSNATTGGAGENTQKQRKQTVSSEVGFDYRDAVQSFIDTTRSIAFNPVSFFSRMVRQGDYINPLVFGLICAEVYAVLQGIVMFFLALAGSGEAGGAFGSLILLIILTPVAGAIALFVRAGVLHLLVALIIKPQTTGFETTFRASTYSLMPVLLAWIPILGPIICGIWSTVLAVLGIRDGHSTSTGKAAAVVLIPVGVMALISIILTIVVWVVISAVFNSVGGY